MALFGTQRMPQGGRVRKRSFLTKPHFMRWLSTLKAAARRKRAAAAAAGGRIIQEARRGMGGRVKRVLGHGRAKVSESHDTPAELPEFARKAFDIIIFLS